jgi:hypothetical protein
MLIEVISMLGRFPKIPLKIMAILMVIPTIIIGYLLILKVILKNLLMLKKFSTLR